LKRVLGAVLVLLAAGCDHLVSQGPRPVYAPWEEGLTLVYLDPSRPETMRQQVRISKSELTPQGRVVVKTTSSLGGESEATYRYQDGLVVQQVDAQLELRILPEGFPDRVSRWEDRGTLSFVVGRARVDLPGVKLPDPDVAGVWVETVPPATGGLRRRTLYVPDFGEVETRDWTNGQWITVNRLISQGFTPGPNPGSSK
jgi:hypothetical protein